MGQVRGSNLRFAAVAGPGPVTAAVSSCVGRGDRSRPPMCSRLLFLLRRALAHGCEVYLL